MVNITGPNSQNPNNAFSPPGINPDDELKLIIQKIKEKLGEDITIIDARNDPFYNISHLATDEQHVVYIGPDIPNAIYIIEAASAGNEHFGTGNKPVIVITEEHPSGGQSGQIIEVEHHDTPNQNGSGQNSGTGSGGTNTNPGQNTGGGGTNTNPGQNTGDGENSHTVNGQNTNNGAGSEGCFGLGKPWPRPNVGDEGSFEGAHFNNGGG